MLPILLAVFVALISVYVWWYYDYIKRQGGISEIPGPTPVPFFGNAFSFSSCIPENFIIVRKLWEQYGPILKIWPVNMKPVVIVADADIAEAILRSTKLITKSIAYDTFIPWLGTGLLISTGEKWHKRRKMLTPTFHFQILSKFIPVFNRCSDILIKKLEEETTKESTNIYSFINRFALDTICETAMGTQVNTQVGNNFEYINAVKQYLQIIIRKQFSMIKQFHIFFKQTSDYKLLHKLVVILHSFTNSVIQKRRQELLKNTKVEMNGEEDNSYKKKEVFLNLLLQIRDEEGVPLSNEDIREEVDTFMFEGHDTISSALSFTLFEIANHPEIQEKIYEEICLVFGKNFKEPFNHDNIKNLRYLEQVIKEGLRLYPSVASYQRQLTEDEQIGKYLLPKGTTIDVDVYLMHRDPRYFPDPEVFDPDRFSTENSAGRHPFCYAPFSAGPRNCIGQKYAMLEMKTAITKILMHYKLLNTEPKHKLELYNDSILKSLNGVYIKVRHRERRSTLQEQQ